MKELTSGVVDDDYDDDQGSGDDLCSCSSAINLLLLMHVW
jgi:hypothetical protein